MGANMKVLKDVSEKIVLLEAQFLRYAEGYVIRDNKFSIHIKKLRQQLDLTEDENEKKLLLETIELLEGEQLEDEQVIDEMNKTVLELNNILQLIRMDGKQCIKGTLGLKLLEVQEEERKRVARELHDSTVQNLTSLIYKAELCSKVLEADQTRVRLELQVMIVSLKSIIEEMRNTIYDLRPTIAEDTNIDNYIEKYVDNLSISYPGIVFKYEVHGNSHAIIPICCLTLLRIVQEACQNAIKHASPRSITVEVKYRNTGVNVCITDNGQGFHISENGEPESPYGHFGVSIMRERAQLLGGVVKITSEENKGTIVNIDVSKVYCGEGDEDGSD